jgi:catechol 2,3-dioxygenase-like lactoylglutathione lyase family enzyme
MIRINAVFHHIALNVNNYERMVDFYEAMGFSKQIEWVEEGLKVCFMDTNNGMFLELHEAKGKFENSRIPHICMYVDNVEEFYRITLEKGEALLIAPGDSVPLKLLNGLEVYTHTCWVKSPNGEVIEAINWKDFDRNNYKVFSGSQPNA